MSPKGRPTQAKKDKRFEIRLTSETYYIQRLKNVRKGSTYPKPKLSIKELSWLKKT